MDVMFRSVLPLVLAAAALAQTPSDLFTRPPKALDDSLRARIKEFYQAHVDGKPRAAEKLVADDTKDFYYQANKPKYFSFEIARIDYSEEFTKAKAIILCEQVLLAPGFAGKPVKVPTPSYWKLVDGQWFWYVDLAVINRTPFGTIKPAEGGAPSVPNIPTEAEAVALLAKVKAEPSGIQLEAGKTATVELHNAAAGVVMLSFFGELPSGVDAIFDQVELTSGARTHLRVRAAEGARPQGTIRVRISPTNQIIPIQISSK